MAAAIEKQPIRVSVLHTSQQPSMGTSLEGFPVYPLKGKAQIPGTTPKNVVFLFPSDDNYKPPSNVRERLSGQGVRVHRLAWLDGAEEYLVAPTEAALGTVQTIMESDAQRTGFNMDTDKPVLAIPDSFKKVVIRDLVSQTGAWFTGWMEGYSMRTVLENWDPYLLIDPNKHTNPYLNQKAINIVGTVIDQGVRSGALDIYIGNSLREGIISPGQEYEKWIDMLRKSDPEVYNKFLGGSYPRQLHQALHDLVSGRRIANLGPLDRVITGNPYSLDGNAKQEPGVAIFRHKQAIDFLVLQSKRFADNPEASLLDRLTITTQIAREYSLWFNGKTENTSQLLSTAKGLINEGPFLSRFLRAMEITEEGQRFSSRLRERYIDDSAGITLKKAA